METIDLVSAIVSFAVVGGLTLRFGLMANATLIAEVLWSRRVAAQAIVVDKKRTIAVNPAMMQR
jgi:hypothetical protein